MIIKKRILKTALCGVLSAGMLFTQPAALSVRAEQAAPAAEATPEPTPDPHSAFYSQKPDTDSIKGWPAGPLIEAEAGIVMDVTTGTVIYAKNMDKKMYPASITKVMTALLACENLDMDTRFALTHDAAFGIEPGSSSIYGDDGEEFSVEQALMGLMLASANEMALGLGEQVSGSVKKFVELMNARARELGCKNTHFNNPNGLPDETHYTTAYDMALITSAAYLNPQVRKIMSTTYYEIPPTDHFAETRYLLNHHKMLPGGSYAYEGALGGKTGYTIAAGNTLVTFAKRDNKVLVSVVLQSVGGGYEDTAALLNYGFDNFDRISLGWNRNPSVSILPSEKYILNQEETDTAFYATRAASAIVPAGKTKKELTSTKSLLPPLSGNYRLRYDYYYNDYPVGYGIRYEQNVLSDLIP
ncbi:MAG: D-alanyl-D-alanine carboxypeptidase [Clostridiales bacterium]|nr:D-alanyl-D-alanine carboxypeptidase [Candidatus Blautia equi]